jgi:hypothetical protein
MVPQLGTGAAGLDSIPRARVPFEVAAVRKNWGSRLRGNDVYFMLGVRATVDSPSVAASARRQRWGQSD